MGISPAIIFRLVKSIDIIIFHNVSLWISYMDLVGMRVWIKVMDLAYRKA